eukprot:144701-Pleurochrysis_carterae.AAC.1
MTEREQLVGAGRKAKSALRRVVSLGMIGMCFTMQLMPKSECQQTQNAICWEVSAKAIAC